jgi:hypothetical protein
MKWISENVVNTTGEEVIPIGNQSQLNLLAVELNDASVRYGARLVRRRIQFNFMANELVSPALGAARVPKAAGLERRAQAAVWR